MLIFELDLSLNLKFKDQVVQITRTILSIPKPKLNKIYSGKTNRSSSKLLSVYDKNCNFIYILTFKRS